VLLVIYGLIKRTDPSDQVLSANAAGRARCSAIRRPSYPFTEHLHAPSFVDSLPGSGLAHAGELPETDWLELMPKSDQKALEAMPEIDHNSPEATGTFTEKGGMKQPRACRR
jgi:hypothetical protein